MPTPASATQPLLLQLTDPMAGRCAALRIDSSDGALPLEQLLDKHLKYCPAEQLLQTGTLDPADWRILQSLQDLVYRCDDQSRLTSRFAGIVIQQDSRPVPWNAPPLIRQARAGDTDVGFIDLAITRADSGYHRHWPGFHCRRWANDPDFFSRFVHDTLTTAIGTAQAEALLRLDTPERQRQFIKILARRIWRSDFESYSRFSGDRLMFKTGDETVRNIAAGAGGICTEKVPALKFITDHYGIPSEYLLAGDNASAPPPLEELRAMLSTYDFRFAQRYMRYWQHIALLYHLDGAHLLVDVTNGNIPFLFLAGADADALLSYTDKQPVKVRMVESVEDYYYHRVPQDIPQNLLFALECRLGDTDLVQVFENELGLYLSADYYIAPIPYRSEKAYQRRRQEYLNLPLPPGSGVETAPDWTLDQPLGRQFAAAHPEVAARILDAREHLLRRYNEWERTGNDAGLALVRLTPPAAG